MLTDKPQMFKITLSLAADKQFEMIKKFRESPCIFTGERGGAKPQDLRQSCHLQKAQMSRLS